MTQVAKALIALVGVVVLVVEAVTKAHGWSGIDWTPIETAAVVALAVYAYPNAPAPPKVPPAP